MFHDPLGPFLNAACNPFALRHMTAASPEAFTATSGSLSSCREAVMAVGPNQSGVAVASAAIDIARNADTDTATPATTRDRGHLSPTFATDTACKHQWPTSPSVFALDLRSQRKYRRGDVAATRSIATRHSSKRLHRPDSTPSLPSSVQEPRAPTPNRPRRSPHGQPFRDPPSRHLAPLPPPLTHLHLQVRARPQWCDRGAAQRRHRHSG